MADKIVVSGHATVVLFDDSGSGTPTLTLPRQSPSGSFEGPVCFNSTATRIYSLGNLGSYVYLSAWTVAGAKSWYRSITGGDGSFPNAICTDTSGNIYIAIRVYNGGSPFRKYNSSGTLQWSKTIGYADYVFSSPANRIYVTNGNILYCYNTSGTLLWQHSVTPDYMQLSSGATSDDVSIYVGGHTWDNSKHLIKLTRNDSQNTVVESWSKALSDRVYSCAVTPSGGVTIGQKVASNISVRQYSASGSLEWESTVVNGGDTNEVKVDGNGFAYSVGSKHPDTGVDIRKRTGAGSLVYGVSYDEYYSSRYLAIWSAPARSDLFASVPIRLALGAIYPGFWHSPPAIGLRVALAGFTPSDTVFAINPCRIYRAFLVDDWLSELPIAEITCKRRKGASTWASIRCPITSAGLRSLCTQHIGRDLVIYAGDEHGLGEYLRAVLTEVASEWTPTGGSLTLTARVQNPNYTATGRALAGVISRGRDKGRRTATGTVEPALRPGDTIDDGAETWIVGSVDVRIGPGMSQMQVAEDG